MSDLLPPYSVRSLLVYEGHTQRDSHSRHGTDERLWDYVDINIVSEDRINRIYTNWPPDKPNNPKWQRESRQLLVQGAG